MKNSEYNRAFKLKQDCVAQIYEENLGFRLNRGHVQKSHDNNPFIWETDSDTSSQEDSRPPSVPVHIFKHEKFIQSYKKRTNSFEKAKSTSARPVNVEATSTVQQNGGLSNGHNNTKVCENNMGRKKQGTVNHPEVRDSREQAVQTPDWKLKQQCPVHGQASQLEQKQIQGVYLLTNINIIFNL
jgi:hypothetical protein